MILITGPCVLHGWPHVPYLWWACYSLCYVPWHPQNIRTCSYCYDCSGVLDNEFTGDLGWGLGFNKDLCIVTCHRGLGWSEHTVDDTYRVLLTVVVHRIPPIPRHVYQPSTAWVLKSKSASQKNTLKKTTKILLMGPICHHRVFISLQLLVSITIKKPTAIS